MKTAAILLAALGGAGAQEVSEYEVKAAFLYNFANPRYFTWPGEAPKAGAPFRIAVLGESPILPHLERLAKNTPAGKSPLNLLRIQDPAAARDCRILFVAASESPRAGEIRRVLADAGVLTVGDTPEFAADGGHVAFAMVDRHVRFDVNSGPASATEPRPTAQLLRVARKVFEQGERR